ncbi:phosphatidylinositol-3-phosphatase ymr1 [Tilletia horrida]|uniref:Phosphatidylinositol-3-phosphatase ymr1 n=1 Tax=Tilletia horrida TaxID=155126 RepID=A0AAN6GHK2_9BASI|nr:phosphatidylinositol-3-phosphatase ymr1 [Tilletia horrida]
MSASHYGGSSSSSSSASSSVMASRKTPRVTKVERVLFQSNQAPSDASSQPGTQTQSQSIASLELSRHHFVLRFAAPAESTLKIPYTLINTLARLPSLPTHDRHTRIYPLGLRLRTFEIYALGFDSEALATDVFETVKAYAVLRSPEQLYAFYRQPQTTGLSQSSPSPSGSGWRFYDPKREFTRQGIGSRTKAWRFTDVNGQYSFSPTYPDQLVVPARISDQTLNYAAKYRSKARIPALTYLHWANYGSITRCSQPLVGLKGNRSAQDEKLVEAIFSSHIFADPNSKAAQAAAAASAAASQSGGVAALGPSAGMVIYGATTTNLIIDARPTTNAMANVAKGAGSENMEHYRGCKKAYLGIDNIHVMRDSLNKLTDALKDAAQPVSFSFANAEPSSSLLDRAGTLNGPRPGAGAGGASSVNGSVYATYRPGRPGSSHASFQPAKPLDTLALKRSNWLKHIAALLEGTMMIVRNVHINSSHALVHCSDGWDRTSQLAALAQICLDPYFRTIDGLAVLIEKDWLSFGHRFEDRSGHLGHPSRFVTDPGHGEPPAGEDWDYDGHEGGGAPAESEGFEPGAAVNALWGFTKQLTAGFAGATGGGSGSNSATNLREISPVFHQFLDCVWQVMRQFPNRFEYNAAFLVEMHAQVYSCEYGTFLLNSERERRALGTDDGKVVRLQDKTPSLWDDLLGSDEQRRRWINDKYDPSLDLPTTATPTEKASAPSTASASPQEEKSEADAASSTTTLVSDGSSQASKPSKFGDMGVLLANPREVRFFADLYRREEREMNALIIAEAQERARYAQRLADAAAGAMAAKAQAQAAAAAAAAAESGAVTVPAAVAVEGGSADPGRDPAAAAALAVSSASATGGSTPPSDGTSLAGGRAGAVDLGTTLSASRLDGTRLAYQPRIPRQPSATMPRSMSGAALSAAPSATVPTGQSRTPAPATANAASEHGLDDAGARMKDLFLGGWGRLQNAIASAGQAAAAATAPAPIPGAAGMGPGSAASSSASAWQQHPQYVPSAQGQVQGQSRRTTGPGVAAGAVGSGANPWATSAEPPLGRNLASASRPRSSGGGGHAVEASNSSLSGMELGFTPRPTTTVTAAASTRPISPSASQPPAPPAKDEPAYLQSNTLTNNPWAAAAAASSRSTGSHMRLEDVFGAEQARKRQTSAGTTGSGRERSPSPFAPVPAPVTVPSQGKAEGSPALGSSYPPPAAVPAPASASASGQREERKTSTGGNSGTSYDPLGVNTF